MWFLTKTLVALKANSSWSQTQQTRPIVAVIEAARRSPEFTMLEHIAEVPQGQDIRNGVARGIALRQAYEAIGGIATTHSAEIQSFREPAPASMEVEQIERDTDPPL
jgi:hypothetical protein